MRRWRKRRGQRLPASKDPPTTQLSSRHCKEYEKKSDLRALAKLEVVSPRLSKSEGCQVTPARFGLSEGHDDLQPCRFRFTSVISAASPFGSNFNMNSRPFPEVQGGGSLIIAWQIRNKRVLVIGGGEVSHSSPGMSCSAQLTCH